MFPILEDIIGYNGSTINNVDSYLLYGSIVLAVVVCAVIVDNIMKFFRSLLPKNKFK